MRGVSQTSQVSPPDLIMLGLPTLHGTGTEDYFNCAWCPTQIYHAPYHGVIAGGGKNWTDPVTVYGFTSRIRLSSKNRFG
jgi:DUF2961 family protein